MSNQAHIISVIPVYNGERFLRATLDSLASQTIQPDRVIVLDDASTDGTAEKAPAAAASVSWAELVALAAAQQARREARTQMAFELADHLVA